MDGEIKIPVCNCGCNETQTAIGKFGYERLFIATMQCTNCGFIVSAIENDFDKAEKSVIEKWCLLLKTKDYPVWARGRKDENTI
jgi:hypothetical protein